LELALESNYKRRLTQIFIIIGSYHFEVEENASEGFRHLKEALKVSEEINDVVSLVLANSWLGLALARNCEFDKSLLNYKNALDINLAANSLWSISAIKSVSSYWLYYMWGRINLCYQTTNEAAQIAEESGDIFSISQAHTAHGISLYAKGYFEEATRHLWKGVELTERSNQLAWHGQAHRYLGKICFQNREYQQSLIHYEKAVWLYEQKELLPSCMNLIRIGAARSKVMNNEKNIDLELLYSYVNENRIKQYDGIMQRYIGDLLMNIDDQHISDAMKWIEKAIEADTKNGMMFYLGNDYASYAELFKRKEDQSRARENLNRAIEIYKECGADGWVEIAEKELASLS